MKKRSILVIFAGVLVLACAVILIRLRFSRDKKVISSQALSRLHSSFDLPTLDYFSEIAFGAEYNFSDFQLSRWRDSVIIVGLYGEPGDRDALLVNRVISTLNSELKTATLQLCTGQTNDEHIQIFFLNTMEIADRYPRMKVPVTGFMDYRKTGSHALERVKIIFNTDIVFLERRKHVLLEEITQSLGLMQDSDKYPTSIFYRGHSSDTILSEMDKQMINILYNYGLPIGLDKKTFIEQVVQQKTGG